MYQENHWIIKFQNDNKMSHLIQGVHAFVKKLFEEFMKNFKIRFYILLLFY